MMAWVWPESPKGRQVKVFVWNHVLDTVATGSMFTNMLLGFNSGILRVRDSG